MSGLVISEDLQGLVGNNQGAWHLAQRRCFYFLIIPNTIWLEGKRIEIDELKVYRKLSLELLKTNANLIRSHSIWCFLRQTDRTNFSYDEILTQFSRLTGCDSFSVRRWLKSGEGIFWRIDNRKEGIKTLWLIGKFKVYKYFNVKFDRNCSFVIKTELLLCTSLQRVKAALFGTWNDKQKLYPISREKLEKYTSVKPRTQFNYDERGCHFRQYNYINTSEGREQTISSYKSPHYRKYMADTNRGKKHHFVTAGGKTDKGNQSSIDNPYLFYVAGKSKKTFFDSKENALKSAISRHKKGLTGYLFYKDKEVSPLNVRWNRLDYSLLGLE